jgi:hypothetical protein
LAFQERKRKEYVKDKFNKLAICSKNKNGIEEQMNLRSVTLPGLT